jgi:hypothetical protein
LFLEDSSHSLVAEAFSMFKTDAPGELHAWRLDVSKSELEFWTAMLPAMVERCRIWEHRGDSGFLNREVRGICSCGRRLANSRFKRRAEWTAITPNVVRCAVRSLYPAQFIHKTKFHLFTLPSQLDPEEEDDFVEENEGDVESLAVQETVPQENACNVCGKGGPLKKCGRCEAAFIVGWSVRRKIGMSIRGSVVGRLRDNIGMKPAEL